MHYAAESVFPNLNLVDTISIARECNIIDEKLTISDIERAFHLTNVEDEEQEENPNNLLCRFEFFEIFVRIGLMKFWERRSVDSQTEAVSREYHYISNKLVKLYEEHLFPHAHTAEYAYDIYRFERIYRTDVDMLLKANIDEIEMVILLDKILSC